MKPPDISVVMGVFNNADTLPAALDSILSQEGVDLEFIVVDDGSTDDSAAILDEAARKDPRLKIVHKRNEGLTRALIDGCALATAPWIARQDADDVSLPGRLAALQALVARHPDAVLLASSARCLGPKGEDLRTVRCTTDPDLARKQVLDLRIGPPAHGSAMFLRAAYLAAGGYRAAFYYAQDSDLWMRLAERGGVAYAGEVLYAFRYAADSISGSRRRIQKIFGRLGRKCREARRANRSEDFLLAEVRRQCDRIRRGGRRASAHGLALGHYHIGCLLEGRQPAAAREYFDAAVAACPWFWKARIKRWRLGRG
jgi:glycosyltransferase involved in cell wall biosynthesis